MRIQVLYFAAARERTKTAREEIDVPEGTTAGALATLLGERHAELRSILGRLRLAVNQDFAEPAQVLREGDEVALIPPVSGGVDPCRVVDRPISAEEVAAAVAGPGAGAVVTFVGAVRGESHGRNVLRLEYEAYAEMADAKMRAIAGDAARKWPGARVAMLHRTGVVQVGEVSVAIAVATAHRAEAFEACRYCIDRLKEEAPIWKREVYSDGSEWVGLGP
jgi:molybdopterin synthase catalytic subunit